MEKPPVIKAPAKRPERSALFRIVLPLLAVLGIVLYSAMPIPPKEIKLLQNFYTNRAAFEQLRDMLQVDQVSLVSRWGVMTNDSYDTNFPAHRFKEYLDLLKRVGGHEAGRRKGQYPHYFITQWDWGWAGDSKHISICWVDQVPTNQIPTLEGQYGRRHPAYRHIEANWYFWVNM